MKAAQPGVVEGGIDALYRAIAEPDCLPDALAQLAALVGGHTALLILHHGPGMASAVCSRGSDPRLVAPDSMAHAPDNPWTRAARGHPPGTVLLTDALVSHEELERSPFYEEVVRPLQIEHGMGCVFSVEGDRQAFVVVHRSARQGPFDEAAVRCYRGLVPHLNRVARLWVGMTEAQAGHGVIAALDRLQMGVVVVDRSRRVCFANRCAGRAFEAATAVALKDGRLVAAPADETAELDRLITAAMARTGGGTTLQCRGHARPVELLVVPLRPTAALPGPGAPVALVLFRNPDEEPGAGLAAVLEQLYQLTPTEARVGQAIAAGHGLGHAARTLGMARSTARTHLYRALDKTGTRRQAELVRLLLGGLGLLLDDDFGKAPGGDK